MLEAITSLDPLETTGSPDRSSPPVFCDVPAPPPLPHSFRSTRDSVLSVLKDLAFRGLVPIRRFSAFEECGSRYVLLRHKDTRSLYRLCSTSCHDRLCPSCGAQRGRELAAGLRDLLKGREWRFITLTIGGEKKSLAASLKHLYDSFRKLRKHPLWKTKVAGGVAILEVTFNQEKQTWHPHFHILAAGTFMPQAALSQAWYDTTLDSKIVHITYVRSHRSIANYLTDYMSKPIPDAILEDAARVEECATDLAAVRRIVPFGVCHGHTRFHDVDESPWQRVGDVAILLRNDDTDPDLALVIRAMLNVCLDDGHAVEFEYGPDP